MSIAQSLLSNFWRIAGAAAAKETAEERDQRYLFRVHRLRSWLLNVLELPHLVIDALEVGNQTSVAGRRVFKVNGPDNALSDPQITHGWGAG